MHKPELSKEIINPNYDFQKELLLQPNCKPVVNIMPRVASSYWYSLSLSLSLSLW